MKFNLTITLVLALLTHLFAQESKTFQILDENKEPVPFAHVHFKNTMNGTIANENGEFRIKAPNLLENPILVISSVGYVAKEIPFDTYKSKTIILVEDVVRLREVTVIPKDYERELLNKAIARIPDNYPVKEERHNGFAREFVYWGDEDKDPVYVIESTLEAIKLPYDQRTRKGHVKASEGRRYVNQEKMDKMPTNIIAGSHHINRFDAVALRSSILKKNADYDLIVDDTLRLYNKDLYKLTFTKGEDVSGYLLIMDSSFAITEAYFDYKGSFPPGYSSSNRKFMNYKVEYEKSEDNKWRYKHSKYHTTFSYWGDDILNLKSEYVSTEVRPNSEDIPYLERIHHNDVFLTNISSYDSAFWKDYTIIIPDETVEKLFRIQPDQEIVKMDSILTTEENSNNRIRTYFELSYIPTDISRTNMSFSNEVIDFSYNENATTDFAANFVYGVSLELIENLWTGFRINTTFTDRRFNSLDLEIMRDININPNGRPLFITPKLVVGHQWLSQPIGSFEHNENYRINGKEFDSGTTNLYLHERGFHLSPMISLGFEKNKVVRYTLSFGTNFFLTRSTGVTFNEDKQFFLTKKNEFLKEGGENLTLDYDDDLISLNWMVSLGIYLHSR